MKIMIGVLLAIVTCNATAQTSNYTFFREGGQISYLDPADTSVLEHIVSDDMVLPAKVKIGFAFTFNGATYDSVGISENGYIWFGPAQASDMEGIINPVTETLPAGVKGVVCAFGVDLHPHVNTGLTTTIRSKTVIWAGKPNDFIVEWRNTSRSDALNDAAGEDTIGFQVQLFAFEMDRVQITYAYDIGLNPNVSSQLSVGMKGESNNDFALRMTDTNHSWDNTLKGTDINSTCTFNTANNPAHAPHNYMSWLNTNPTDVKPVFVPQFNIYPVPAEQSLNLECSNATIESYGIYALDGRLIADGVFSGEQILLDGMPCGVYLLRIKTSEGVYTRRFSKN